ncbi:type III-B CRISPR module-associated Cmr3 family protein [Microseira sp. BLCC-F43]|jgi:hypothetical protein|uniref:type III-B CRISPR module-associated Cmr3 family protein n=1 Tax=Microseira sp. BLCC-F43 TaxID=3153602 RepID=UPI0035BA101D
MTGWYTIAPAGAIAIGNLTPVGQNSGQVGCRWPPNGHQLAACLNLPKDCQLWGPFWYSGREMYVTLPLPVYCLESKTLELPQEIFRMQWRDEQWQVRPEHQAQAIELIGGRYLIAGKTLKQLWQQGQMKNSQLQLQELPWQTLTLSHNSREDYQVKDEGGFFAEMTTLIKPGWSILVKVIGEYEKDKPDDQKNKPKWSFLGAGATPVLISPVRVIDSWLTAECSNSTGAVLLTGALWQQGHRKVSCPVPSVPIKAYAAETGIPWQSWKKVKHHDDSNRRVQVLTPGEWMTPAGAVYLWEGTAPLKQSEPLPDSHHRHVLGYGHLWLFEDKLDGN